MNKREIIERFIDYLPSSDIVMSGIGFDEANVRYLKEHLYNRLEEYINDITQQVIKIE